MNLLGVFGIGVLRILQANFTKRASAQVKTKNQFLSYCLYFEVFAFAFSFLQLFLMGFHGFDSFIVICGFLTGISFVLEIITALRAMQSAPLVLCNIFSLGGGIIIPSVISIFYFNQKMSYFSWLGVGLFFVAVALISPNSKDKKALTGKALLILFLNFLINGFASFMGQFYSIKTTNFNGSLFSGFCYLSSSTIFLLIILFTKIKSDTNTKVFDVPKKTLLFGGLLGIICPLIIPINSFLLRLLPVVIVNTVPSVMSVIGCAVVGFVFFKEKLSFKNILGVLAGILSTVLIIMG